MKKVLIIATAVLGFGLAMSAQDRFQLGVKGGFTSTQYTTDNLKSPEWPNYEGIKEDAKAGYLFGAYARAKVIGNISLQPELYYAKKSGQAKYDTGDGTLSQDIDIHTWDIPILVHFNLIDLKVAKLYGLTGPVVSFNAKNGTSLSGYGKDDVKKATWAYQLGGGLEVWKFNLDVRYEWGLSNVSNGLSDVEFERKSNMLTFALGYRLLGF
ncbi:MAG: porin family protein [Breznakibacter sp.]